MVDDEELNDEVLDIARTIADNAPLSVAASKLTINEMLKDESQRDMAAIAADGGGLLQQRRLQGGTDGVHGEARAAVGGTVGACSPALTLDPADRRTERAVQNLAVA